MSDTNASNNVCVYCGSTEALTDDHIPPKTLFPKPRPANLITVRSCRSCNEGASKDDEYFRLVISMRHDSGDHPAVKKILPSIYRSLQKSNKKGFQQALFNSMCDLDITSRGGISLGTAPGYDVDLHRLDRVAARITTGLYFHEIGTRVPDNRHVKAYSASGLTHVDSDTSARIIDICDKVGRNPPKVFGENIFAYWFQQVHGDPTMSAWVLAFYEKVVFLCLVTPNEKTA